jgi:hypothetical protein
VKARKSGAVRALLSGILWLLTAMLWIPASLLMFLGIASVFIGLALGVVALFTAGLAHVSVHAQLWASLGLVTAGVLLCLLAQCGLASVSGARDRVRRER